ncbi:MAG: DUF222 domain-containing protein, partial [Acidimicrobiales bacterium]
WDLDAATSMTAWLRDHARMTRGDAARTVASAKRLRSLPLTTTAAGEGALSAGQVKVILANVTDRSADLFATHEEAVVPQLVRASVTETESAMRWWAVRADSTLDDPKDRPEPKSKLHLSQTLANHWRLDGELDPLSGEVLDTALRLAEAPLDDAESEGTERSTPSQRRAVALDLICRWFLEHRDHPPASRHRPHVNAIVDAEDLEAGRGGHFPDGTTIDGPSLASLVCDSVIHRLVMAGGSTILDYGTGTRTISPALFNAVAIRDHHCRFPGCDRRASWCEVHHVVHVQDGGATCPSNVTLLCSRHHHRLHQPGWRATLAPDGELVVTDPGGRKRSTRPPGRSPRPPPERLVA